ncbi:hypothetical protein [Streptomyces sp. NBRC 14336]|uniref:hypothetical protein n=1 Tax=Streptomyces sp. NBRC 14336 TaxID=3030992 RepID=UPI002554F97D|nr:hypothetical protein [Streptomyces sp. NBRC 14336]
MRGRHAVGAALLAAVLLAGCQSEEPVAQNTSSAPVERRPQGYGSVFLAVDECSSFGTTSFTEVPCDGERAAARVVARHDGTVEDGPPCPGTTDFVLHISEQSPSDEDGDGAVPQGYACMRNLEPPHPGDPGAGGGPRTIVGDCVYSTGGGRQVRETSCDGKSEKKPQYKVVKAVGKRSQCPASTALYVQLGGERPVGCARPV